MICFGHKVFYIIGGMAYAREIPTHLILIWPNISYGSGLKKGWVMKPQYYDWCHREMNIKVIKIMRKHLHQIFVRNLLVDAESLAYIMLFERLESLERFCDETTNI